MLNFEDANFVEALRKLTNLTKDQAQGFIENCDIDQLNELSNALSTANRARALQLYYLFKNNVVESINKLNIGDLVYIGKNKARVHVPNGPGNTVGVMIGNRLKMVDRRKISLSENVIGMTQMPGLDRMQALAGIFPEPAQSTPVTAEVIEDESDYDENMTTAMNAISVLREIIPEIQIKDAKTIRQAIGEILGSINESVNPAPKNRRLKD